MDNGELTLTVLLPAFNEERVIAAVVCEARLSLADWDGGWEILVVDDGSTDRTAEAAVAAGARVACRATNGGYGAAVKTGIEQARGRLLALIDADGSYKPADCRRLLSALWDLQDPPQTTATKFDLVNGVRSQEHGPWRNLRRLVKGSIRKLAEWMSGRHIPDLNTGIKVFRRELMLDYFWLLPDGFSCSTSMTLALLCDGRAVRFVPVDYRPRVGQSKFRPVRDTARYLLAVVRVVLYFRPLRVLFPVALFFASLAAMTSVSHIVHSSLGPAPVDVIFGLLSLTILTIGLIADRVVARRLQRR